MSGEFTMYGKESCWNEDHPGNRERGMEGGREGGRERGGGRVRFMDMHTHMEL